MLRLAGATFPLKIESTIVVVIPSPKSKVPARVAVLSVKLHAVITTVASSKLSVPALIAEPKRAALSTNSQLVMVALALSAKRIAPPLEPSLLSPLFPMKLESVTTKTESAKREPAQIAAPIEPVVGAP